MTVRRHNTMTARRHDTMSVMSRHNNGVTSQLNDGATSRPNDGVTSLGNKRAACRPTFVDASESPVVHLVGAVEDDNVLPEAARHVLGRLRLARPRRPRRRAPQGHAQGLREGDVTPATERHVRQAYDVFLPLLNGYKPPPWPSG